MSDFRETFKAVFIESDVSLMFSAFLNIFAKKLLKVSAVDFGSVIGEPFSSFM